VGALNLFCFVILQDLIALILTYTGRGKGIQDRTKENLIHVSNLTNL
jgi:hypothetical protein